MHGLVATSDIAQRIEALIAEARKRVVASVNTTMVYTYYEVGRIIVEDEQQGEQRAEYGKALLKDLSKQLTKKFGKGFSAQNLANMRQFYLIYSQQPIFQTPSRKSPEFTLSWSHYVRLMRMENPEERRFYEIEATQNNWRIKHQDLGQMQMYVNYYDRYVKLEDENPTIGILLCRDKSDAVVEITLPKDNNQIFASKYQTILPSKEELKKILVAK